TWIRAGTLFAPMRGSGTCCTASGFRHDAPASLLPACPLVLSVSIVMKTGIIGLPQVGKTSLFRILTKAKIDAQALHSREAHVGIARVPDERLDKLSALFTPKKTTHATVEYVDVAASGREALKEAT